MEKNQELSEKQKETLNSLRGYIKNLADPSIRSMFSTQKAEVESKNKHTIFRGDDEYRTNARREIGRTASLWEDRSLQGLSTEERNNIDFRTEVMKIMSAAAREHNANINSDENSLIEAILYCPEGIKEWYNAGIGFNLHTKPAEVHLSPEIIEKLETEHPEILDKLPQDIISKEVKTQQITPPEATKNALRSGITTDQTREANVVESELNQENIIEGVERDD